jgi:DNA-binding transcriptional LysR family regulator
MNLRQIEVFRAVMLAGSASGAAQLLHVSQPAVSRIFAHTEQRLGFALFQRLRGRLHPTQHAHKLFSEVEVLYQNVKRIQGLANDIANQHGGVLRLGCSPSLAYSLMPLAITQFAQRCPDIQVVLEELLVEPLMDAILTQRIDLAIAIVPIQHSHIQSQNLFRNRIVAALPVAHRLATRKNLRVADLGRERIIGYAADTPLSHAIGRLYDGAQVAPRWVAEVRQTHVACAMVQQGLGVALVDEQTQLSGAWPGIVLRDFTPTIDLQIRIAFAKHEPSSAIVQAFIEELQALSHPCLIRAK